MTITLHVFLFQYKAYYFLDYIISFHIMLHYYMVYYIILLYHIISMLH